jgi:hypothetical protein
MVVYIEKISQGYLQAVVYRLQGHDMKDNWLIVGQTVAK